MEYAQLFDNVMRYIWGDDNPPHDFFVKAIADKIRGTSRINPENALDVLDLLGPETIKIMDVRAAESNDPSDHDVAIFTVKFHDGSSIIVEAKRGIGCGVEVI